MRVPICTFHSESCGEEFVKQSDLIVSDLGPGQFESPLCFKSPSADETGHFVDGRVRIRCDIDWSPDDVQGKPLTFEKAGPRKRLFFNPSETCAAIVTCGGLSPGLNNVIRSLYYEMTENYGVRRVIGIRNGYLGMNPEANRPPIELDYARVSEIHKLGGTVLGTSRGPQSVEVMADFLVDHQVNILFCIGGDGTQRGAHALHQELRRRGQSVAVVGIPKTIDNDIPFVQETFGYATSLEVASEVIRGAHVEARDAVNGIGLVKLMGRDSGHIAAGASVVAQEVNFCLIPEIPVSLEGDHGFLAALESRMKKRGHAVVVVAEGAGQHLFDQAGRGVDASGNRQHHDIGLLLREEIKRYFAEKSFPISLKYLDPSYHIRSIPATVFDRFLCDRLARHAVHAAMAGKTGLLVGTEHDQFIHVPIPTVVSHIKKLDPTGELWRAVLQVTRQPRW